MKKASLLSLLLTCTSIPGVAQGNARACGVQINVTDMKKAIGFFGDALGFGIEAMDSAKGGVLLQPKTGDGEIMLNKVACLLPVDDNEARAMLTLQVNHLDSTIASLKSKGIAFGRSQKRKEGVGYAVYVDDPFGTRLSLMQETAVSHPYFTEPRIYDYGFYVPDMDTAVRFYTTLPGFMLRSQKYLPLDAPLNNPDGSFGFMLHSRTGVQAIRYNDAANEHLVLPFRTNNIEQAKENVKAKGVKPATDKAGETVCGRMIPFYDPFGYISLLIETKE